MKSYLACFIIYREEYVSRDFFLSIQFDIKGHHHHHLIVPIISVGST